MMIRIHLFPWCPKVSFMLVIDLAINSVKFVSSCPVADSIKMLPYLSCLFPCSEERGCMLMIGSGLSYNTAGSFVVSFAIADNSGILLLLSVWDFSLVSVASYFWAVYNPKVATVATVSVWNLKPGFVQVLCHVFSNRSSSLRYLSQLSINQRTFFWIAEAFLKIGFWWLLSFCLRLGLNRSRVSLS